MRTGKVARIADRVRKELGELTPQERDLAVKALRDALYEGFALDAATSDPKQMEKFARERYNMKKKDEDIYIIKR